MVINKRKKNSRQRGSKTHGWGSMKKHRGAGSRGGRGRAGTGKRCDTKKTSYWHEKYFGKQGLKSRKKREKTINTFTIELKLNKWLKDKKVKKISEQGSDNTQKQVSDKQDTYIIDLNKLGYDKLLCKNIVKFKLDITVKKCSKQAKDKIEKAGGKVTLIEPKKKEKKVEEKKDKTEKSKKQTKQEVTKEKESKK